MSITVRRMIQTEDLDCIGSMHLHNAKQSTVSYQGALAQGVGSSEAFQAYGSGTLGDKNVIVHAYGEIMTSTWFQQGVTSPSCSRDLVHLDY